MKCSKCDNEAVGMIATIWCSRGGEILAYEFRCNKHSKIKIKVIHGDDNLKEIFEGIRDKLDLTFHNDEEIDFSLLDCDECCIEIEKDDSVETIDDRILCFGCDSKRLM